MNRHLTLDGASVNSELCSDHHCNGLTQAIAEKDALLAEMADVLARQRPWLAAARRAAVERADEGEALAAGAEVALIVSMLAKYEAQK